MSWFRHGRGYARIQPAARSTAPVGLTVIGYQQRGVLISETTVSAFHDRNTDILIEPTDTRRSSGRTRVLSTLRRSAERGWRSAGCIARKRPCARGPRAPLSYE